MDFRKRLGEGKERLHIRITQRRNNYRNKKQQTEKRRTKTPLTGGNWIREQKEGILLGKRRVTGGGVAAEREER